MSTVEGARGQMHGAWGLGVTGLDTGAPHLSKATQAPPTPTMAKASSFVFTAGGTEVGTTGKEREKCSFIPGLKLIKGRAQHTKSFSDCKNKKIK